MRPAFTIYLHKYESAFHDHYEYTFRALSGNVRVRALSSEKVAKMKSTPPVTVSGRPSAVLLLLSLLVIF